MSTRMSREGYLRVFVPHHIVADENFYIWLDDTLGDPGKGKYFWQETLFGHYLHLKSEDMMAFKLVFKV